MAILGTTAKVKEQNDVNSEESHERLTTDEGQCPSISVTEPEGEETDEKDVTEVEQVGLEEKSNNSNAQELKNTELIDTNEQDVENKKTDAVQSVTNNEIIDKPQTNLESIESPENAPSKAPEDIPSKIDQTEAVLEDKTEEIKNDQNQDERQTNENKEPEENQELLQNSLPGIVESHEIKPNEISLQTQGDVQPDPLYKEETKASIKEPVRIVDYQEKKDVFQQKKDDGKALDTKNPEEDTKEELSENKIPENPKPSPITGDISSDEVKIPNETEIGSPDESKTEEDNDISSEQLKTNSLSDMSLSEVLNSEGEEAAREAAKAQELQEMVASLSATASRTLDYEIPASDSSSNSKDFLHNDGILAASTSDSNGSEILPDASGNVNIVKKDQPEPLKETQTEVETIKQPETEILKGSEKETEQQIQLVITPEDERKQQQEVIEPTIKEEITEELKIIQEKTKEPKNEEEDTQENVEQPEVEQGVQKPEKAQGNIQESKGEPVAFQDSTVELEKLQEAKENILDHQEKKINVQENPEEQLKIQEQNVLELQEEQEQIPESKIEYPKEQDVVEEKYKVQEHEQKQEKPLEHEGKHEKPQEHEGKQEKPQEHDEGQEKIEGQKEEPEIIQEPIENEQKIMKTDGGVEKLMEPEKTLQKLIDLEEEQENEKKPLEEKKEVTAPEKNESFEKQQNPAETKEQIETSELNVENISKNNEIQQEDKSIPLKEEVPTLTHNESVLGENMNVSKLEENNEIEPHAHESPSDRSEPVSNESNDESKQTEESKLSDKEEVTELGISEDNSNKEKDPDSIFNRKSGESSSVKDDVQSVESNKEQEASHEDSLSAADLNNLNVAATTIQSTFRGFKTRKQLKENAEEEDTQHLEKESVTDEETNKDIEEALATVDTPETKNINEKDQECLLEHQKEDKLGINEGMNLTEQNIQSNNSKPSNVPEPLMKIAQAEVDRICQEAERATESLMTPPPMIEDSDIRVTDQEDSEDFPAPPDDLMDSIGKNEITKDHDSSGTQSTEPTVPLGSNTDGDSSKTEDTTAPSLAESEIKSVGPTLSQHNDDYKLESSFTENINTEVAVNRDSTEGELTMEEDSKEEDLGSVLHSNKEQELDENDKSENKIETTESSKDNAAAIIQAGYRGFKTRKDLKKVTDISEVSSGKAEKDDISIQQDISTEKNDVISPQESNEDSESETKDDKSSTSKSEEELNESAKKIQAGIRGYLVRKDQKVKRDAAVKIQSHFRGFKTRQRLKQESP